MFCTLHRCHTTEIRDIFTRMRQYHADKPECWLRAIRWEREYNCDRTVEQDVRQLLTQAMRRHPSCTAICVELLEITLSGAGKPSTSSDLSVLPVPPSTSGSSTDAKEVLLQKARIAYKMCANANSTLDFHVAMLEEAMRHSFTESLQRDILERMRDDHKDEPLFWHTIAQRELYGYCTFEDKDDDETNADDEATTTAEAPVVAAPAITSIAELAPNQRIKRETIERAVQVYDAAVERLDTEEMWNYYLDAMLMLNRDPTPRLLTIRRRMLGRACKRADVADRLSERHYLHYVEILYAVQQRHDVIEAVLKRAIAKFSASLAMWQLYMRHYIRIDRLDEVRRVFELSRKKLAQQALPLWELYLQALLCEPEANRPDILALYEESMQQYSAGFAKLKCGFLEWLLRLPAGASSDKTATSNGGGELEMKRVRLMFKRCRRMGTACNEMYAKMDELEAGLAKPNLAEWQSMLSDWTTVHGREHREPWTRLTQFTARFGPEHSRLVVDAARQELAPDSMKMFMTLRDMNRAGLLAD